MSVFNRDRHRKKLDTLLSRSDDEAFLRMVWAVDALQSDRVKAAAAYLTFPPDAATSDIASKFAIYKWDLETLVGQLLITPKRELREGPNRITDCSKFAAVAAAVNHLRNLENEESGIYLKRFNVLNEVHRIGQRQFPWQRGYLNSPQFYRYSLMYGQGGCNDYFTAHYQISAGDFAFVAYVLFVSFQRHPFLARHLPLKQFGISQDKLDTALALLAVPMQKARRETRAMIDTANAKHGNPLPTAYYPSFLRRFPILASDKNPNALCSPLPQLLLVRATAGLYYDLIPGGQNLLNEANKRFEKYCADFTAAMLPRFDVSQSYKYGASGYEIDTPDVLIRDKGEIVVAIECKATKLTYLAQFAEDPIASAKAQYDQISNGVFQLWRFFSHARRGLLQKEPVSPDSHGIVLTLDTFMMMSGDLHNQVLAAATALAEKDPEILPQDRRKVVFCSIQDLEGVLTTANEDAFLATMTAAREERFLGWLLPEVNRSSQQGEPPERKKFPFTLDDVLPWWKPLKLIVDKDAGGNEGDA